MTLIITPGSKAHVDIDWVASAIALQEFYKLQWKDVWVCWSENLTATIPKRFYDFLGKFEKQEPKPQDKIILVDVSDKEFLENKCFFNLDNVIEIFDHHPWYEDFWKEKIWDKSHIEEIGAAATQIARFIIENNMFDKISKQAKELLACAILSNTVNFTLKMTQEVDKNIYKKILEELEIDIEAFRERYFREVDENYLWNPDYFLENDIKLLNIWEKTIKVSQIEMTENKKFVENNLEKIKKVLSGSEDYSFLITSSALKQKTYFISFCDYSKSLLEEVLWLNFIWNILEYDWVMLRKQILKKLLNKLW